MEQVSIDRMPSRKLGGETKGLMRGAMVTLTNVEAECEEEDDDELTDDLLIPLVLLALTTHL